MGTWFQWKAGKKSCKASSNEGKQKEVEHEVQSSNTLFFSPPFKLAMCYIPITFTLLCQISKKAGRFVVLRHPPPHFTYNSRQPKLSWHRRTGARAPHAELLGRCCGSSSSRETAQSPQQPRLHHRCPEPHAPSLVCALVICRSQSAAFSFSRPMIWRLRSLREMWSPSKVTVS